MNPKLLSLVRINWNPDHHVIKKCQNKNGGAEIKMELGSGHKGLNLGFGGAKKG